MSKQKRGTERPVADEMNSELSRRRQMNHEEIGRNFYIPEFTAHDASKAFAHLWQIARQVPVATDSEFHYVFIANMRDARMRNTVSQDTLQDGFFL